MRAVVLGQPPQAYCAVVGALDSSIKIDAARSRCGIWREVAGLLTTVLAEVVATSPRSHQSTPATPQTQEPMPSHPSSAKPDVYNRMYAPKPSIKPQRPSTSTSATSRKNKLQRCSKCGGLGHKSRTCETEMGLKDAMLEPTDSSSDTYEPPPSTVLAAYGLLALNGQSPALKLLRQSQLCESRHGFGSPTSPHGLHSNGFPSLLLPSSPSSIRPWQEPLSPRLLAA